MPRHKHLHLSYTYSHLPLTIIEALFGPERGVIVELKSKLAPRLFFAVPSECTLISPIHSVIYISLNE